MPDNTNRVESHGCIVCGKLYDLLVVYSPAGRMVDYTVISPGGRVAANESRPLAACSTHSGEEVEKALARYQKEMKQAEDEED